MLQTRYNRGTRNPEINVDPSMTETLGYISTQKRIENMISAGQRLQIFRESQFDFPDPKNRF